MIFLWKGIRGVPRIYLRRTLIFFTSLIENPENTRLVKLYIITQEKKSLNVKYCLRKRSLISDYVCDSNIIFDFSLLPPIYIVIALQNLRKQYFSVLIFIFVSVCTLHWFIFFSAVLLPLQFSHFRLMQLQ